MASFPAFSPPTFRTVRHQSSSFVSPVRPQRPWDAVSAELNEMAKALTDTLLRSIPAPGQGRTEIADLKATGLAFRVTSSGARSWSFRFRDPKSGKTARATIGPYPAVPLSLARQRADAMRTQVATGENPVEARRRERRTAATKTFQALADRYLNEHARRHKRSADADERNLKLHILPKWKTRRFEEITRADVIELIEGLVADHKPTLANRVQALISSIFSFAMDAELVKGNPCARLRRRGVETVKRRVLTDDEIGIFWQGITQKPVSERVGLALRFVLLTGVRPGEAAGMALREIQNIEELGAAKWIIPAERSKNGRAHLVPLSDLTRQTVCAALRLASTNQTQTGPDPKTDIEHVFPSPSVKGSPITEHALAVAMARFAKNLRATKENSWTKDPPTPHDLRRTAATRLAAMGIPKEDRDAILNHTPRDVGKKHYDLYEREREKRSALTAWSEAILLIIEKHGTAKTQRDIPTLTS
jgi:integrase